MKLLVCGGLGFIGINFIKLISESRQSFQITVLDKQTYAAHEPGILGNFPQTTFTHGDICNRDLINKLVAEHDAVINFAAETHNDKSILQPERFFSTNLDGVLSLAEACRRYEKRLHHVSTDEVFGDTAVDSELSFNADSPYRPSSPYSASKASADLLLRAWYRTYNLKVTISNCTNNFGPFQNLEKLIPSTINRIVNDLNPQLYGDGHHVRDWIHVEDHCKGILVALESGEPGETYLFGASDEISNIELVTALIEVSRRKDLEIDYVEDRPGHDRRYSLDWAKTSRQLGWRPTKPKIREQVQVLYDWYANRR